MANDLKIVRKHIGASVRKCRKKAGFTQLKLSIMLEMHDEYISQIERGTALPSIYKLYMIAEALKIEVWELLK